MISLDVVQKANDWKCPNCGQEGNTVEDGIEHTGNKICLDQSCLICESNWQIVLWITAVKNMNVGYTKAEADKIWNEE